MVIRNGEVIGHVQSEKVSNMYDLSIDQQSTGLTNGGPINKHPGDLELCFAGKIL